MELHVNMEIAVFFKGYNLREAWPLMPDLSQVRPLILQ